MKKYHDTQNLYLIGLMGAGKTTIGRQLARQLGLEFLDSDREIERRTGVSIPTIFEIEGEEGFRRREAQTIAELATCSRHIIATGGGVVLREENRHRLKSSGYVVYLNVPPEILWERTRLDKNRPLLTVDNPLQRLRELFVARDPLYREIADRIVEGGRSSADSIVQHLLRELGAHCFPSGSW